jgi:hypothetical protein
MDGGVFFDIHSRPVENDALQVVEPGLKIKVNDGS